MTVNLIQRSLLGGVLFLAAVWFGFCWQTDRLGWLPVVPIIAAFVYLLIMVLEFSMMAQLFDERFGPRPALLPLARALLGEIQAAVRSFCWEQPLRSNQYPDLTPSDAMGRRGLILVHGYLCNRGVWNRWMPDLAAARVPTLAIQLPDAFVSISSSAPVIEEAVSRMSALTGRPPVVVAHSMGGLAVRHWWAQSAGGFPVATPAHDADPHSPCGERLQIERLVTIGTPHQGTWLARWAFSQNAREMRIGSDWLRNLLAMEPASHRGRTICYFSSTDNVVFPAWCATLPDADSKQVLAAGHVALLDCPELRADVLRLLQEPLVSTPQPGACPQGASASISCTSR